MIIFVDIRVAIDTDSLSFPVHLRYGQTKEISNTTANAKTKSINPNMIENLKA